MARLYPKGAPRDVIDHPQWGHFTADPEHGGFDLPDEMSDEMHGFHHRGQPVWETEDERSLRLHAADLARRRDPAALFDAFGDFAAALTGATARLGPPADRETEIADLRKRLAELEQPGDGAEQKAPAAVKPAAK